MSFSKANRQQEHAARPILVGRASSTRPIQWKDSWHVDDPENAGSDCVGWRYGFKFASLTHSRPAGRCKAKKTDVVRRRRWVRTAIRPATPAEAAAIRGEREAKKSRECSGDSGGGGGAGEGRREKKVEDYPAMPSPPPPQAPSLPVFLCCPITKSLFNDPVILISTGDTYEKAALVARDGASVRVYPNRAIRDAVGLYRSRAGLLDELQAAGRLLLVRAYSAEVRQRNEGRCVLVLVVTRVGGVYVFCVGLFS